jgi:hypothetical protein
VAVVPGSIFFYSVNSTSFDILPQLEPRVHSAIHSEEPSNDPEITSASNSDIANRTGTLRLETLSRTSHKYVRVAICKELRTLEAAVDALKKYFVK